MTVALPDVVQYGQVTWAALSAVADGNDIDAAPDAVPVSGSVTFTPSAAVLLASAVPVTIMATPVTYQLDSAGVLRDSAGRSSVTLLATDSPGITPTGWTWRCDYKLNGGLSRGSFSFQLPAGTTVDLTQAAPVSSSGGVPIVQGPPGPAGSAWPLVINGADPTVPRPATTGHVIWFGSVQPTNMADGDVYVPVTAN